MKNNDFNEKEFQGGERLYVGKTKSDDNSINEHFSRYKFAKKYLKPDFIVLDAACGTGYGSEFISDSVEKVIGIEISDHALEWGKKHHQKTNIEFKKGNLNNPLDVPSESVDTVISFETLEHVENQENMLSEFNRVLKPGGLFFISSPDREILTEKAGDDNKFHIHELSKKEFVSLLKKYFKIEELYGQTKYVELPWHKKAIKILAKFDIFKIRRLIVKLFGLKLFIHKNFSPMENTSLEKTELNSKNNFYVLLAVCRKI